MKARFSPVARELEENDSRICEELLSAQGHSVDIGGYFFPDESAMEKAMRPSPTFNAIIDALLGQ